MTSIRLSGCILGSLRSIWQDRLVDESWGSDPFGGLGEIHCYTWAYDVNRLGNPVTY